MGAKYTVSETGPKIDEFLDTILDDASLDLDYTIEPGDQESDFETPDLMVKFTGPDVGMLLENKTELLLALEQLTSEVLRMQSDEHSRVCFDANEHRALRIEELRMSAAAAAERVAKTGNPFHFSPMNSRERRIIHLALRNETAVRSESVGMAPYRQVVIVPADMKELPPPVIPPKPPPERPFGDRDRGPRRDGDRRGGPPGRGGRGGPPRGRR